MRCETCKKLKGKKCVVLTEKIGEKQDCWAWTDDPEWQEKARKAVEDYKLTRLEVYTKSIL